VPRPFISTIIEKLAPKMGAQVLMEPEYGFVGMIRFANGKSSFFRNHNFNINPQGAAAIAHDKGYAAFFLHALGYVTPEGQTFFSEEHNKHLTRKRTIDDGYAYAKALGFPVIVKPNDGRQGKLVTKVYNKTEYYRAARKILNASRVMLVQRYCVGNDYRVVVMDDEVISVYQRKPLVVEGDGKATIAKLLARKAREYIATGRDTKLNSEDFRIGMKLKRQGLSLNSVPKNGEVIELLDNANLSTGGDAIEWTHKIHPDFSRLCINITRDMGLRLCGVDIITQDIAKPLRGQQYIVLEINSAPGLDNYAFIGKKQHQRMETLYRKVLLALEQA
jgi:D-alanine-D-alanine ligase-like ATP-grasp enzyme